MRPGQRWPVRNHFGNIIHLTDERWDHITDPINHPEMIGFEEELKEAIRTGERRQDPINPRKYRYVKVFDNLDDDNTHIIAIVLFGFTVDNFGQPVANNYIMTAYQKEIG